MNEAWPKISVIIPARSIEETIIALKALKKADYPPFFIEIILALGFSPSKQRNLAAQEARGEILYFLDNDSEISKNALKRCVGAFHYQRLGRAARLRVFSLLPQRLCVLFEKKFFQGRKSQGRVGAVGGPSLWNKKESFWQSVAGIIFESFFAYFIMTSRFRPTGRLRPTNERELILCNLAVQRKVFQQLGGFREELYPNEENEFLNRLTEKGYDVLYHPGIFVFRPRRDSMALIIRMFFIYGKGRMEHMKIKGVKSGTLFLLPAVLLVYILALFFFHPFFAFLPLLIYFALGFGSALGFARRRKKVYLAFFLPLLFLLVHLSYGGGLLFGLRKDFKKIDQRKSKQEITIIKIKKFTQTWDHVSI